MKKFIQYVKRTVEDLPGKVEYHSDDGGCRQEGHRVDLLVPIGQDQQDHGQ